jgi:hypothetical protein
MLLTFALACALELRPVAPSAYQMNDPLSGVPVRVVLDGFAITKTLIAQRDYALLMGVNPSRHRGPKLPVENVSWHDAIAFANALSVKEKLTRCYPARPTGCNGYRLPTEAEWIAAAGEEKPTGALGVAGVRDAAALRDRPTQPVDERMFGNVWQWCEDWFAPERSPWPVRNPRGPLRGWERVIRGGSTVSTIGAWARQYRSGRVPDWRSGRTGFRLVRSTGEVFLEERLPLPKPVVASAPAHWRDALGATRLKPFTPVARGVRPIEHPYFNARLMELAMEPDAAEKVLVLYPDADRTRKRPVLIVPYYDVDTPAAMALGGRNFQPLGVRSYAWLAAQQGWIAVAIRWFGESYGERYDEAVARLDERHPDWSGLGKWTWDAQRLVDWIGTQPGMDSGRIAMMGHSLGGKMTLYAMAFEPRIRLGVASEPGISLKFSNYGDYWYLGARIGRLPAGADQHELLRMIAPRPFHLIAGEDSDGEKSRAVLEQARIPNWDLRFTNHKAGHTPTPASIGEAFAWLRRYLGH